MDRWDGPFNANVVRGFLAHMREGATVELFRTRRAPGIEDLDLLGWFQREADGRFVGLTAAGNVLPGYGLRLNGAVDAFLELQPEWALHNVAYEPAAVLGAVTDVNPRLHDAVREVVADPDFGGSRWLELRKIDHWNRRLHDWGLADAALTALGYPDKTERTSRSLAPTVREAFEEFKAKRDDLEPW